MTLGLAGIDNSYCNTKVEGDYIYKTLVLKYTLTFALLKPGGCHLGPESIIKHISYNVSIIYPLHS